MKRIPLRHLAMMILIVAIFSPLAASHAQDGDEVDRQAAAELIIAALASQATYESYEIETTAFVQIMRRSAFEDGTWYSDDTIQNLSATTRLDFRGESPAWQYNFSLNIEGEGFINGDPIGVLVEMRGESRLVDDEVFYFATADGPALPRNPPPEGWQRLDSDTPPDFYRAEALRLEDALALAAGEGRLVGELGDGLNIALERPEDILSRVEEVRVADGRTTEGDVVTVYRLIGNDLADVVAYTLPIDYDESEQQPLVIAGISDVSIAFVIDRDGQLRSRIISYNLSLDSNDGFLPASEGVVDYRLVAGVSIVEQYRAINADMPPLTAPEVEETGS